ncbi:mitochondrial ribosomal protein L4 (uL4m) [Andalucia godoyi]|uniref:Large ribosomal subunit protein uL4m n=1 Tax=Andalucia godoyi TaxID=505711 RepID=A0A8K0AJA0_ANDGO|nr:mitochondrial ribosomal protein L4 (uL4m) [Andalucia godoyi]|eukprot:ANDGO_00588.mRNA.1 mitochondrial ribosomal protein L4 (uL4m)
MSTSRLLPASLPLISLTGAASAGAVSLPSSLFALPRSDILHRMVLYQLLRRRQGTASTLTRSEVAGTTRKIKPQKHSGGARHGDNRSNIFVGGGLAKGPKPVDYAGSTSLPKKIRKLALKMALGACVLQDKLRFVDIEALGSSLTGKTSEVKSLLASSGLQEVKKVKLRALEDKTGEEEYRKLEESEAESKRALVGGYSRVLMISGEENAPELLVRGAANLPSVSVVGVRALNVFDLLKSDTVVMSPKVLDYWSAIMEKTRV